MIQPPTAAPNKTPVRNLSASRVVIRFDVRSVPFRYFKTSPEAPDSSELGKHIEAQATEGCLASVLESSRLTDRFCAMFRGI